MRVVSTPLAPAAIGPYSQAVAHGDLIWLSGQIPLHPQTGQLVDGGIDVQTTRVLDNIQAVLDAAGSSLASVVKTTVFLTDMNDFPVVNEIYGRYFTGTEPARSTVQVAALPRGARIEIEVVAVRG